MKFLEDIETPGQRRVRRIGAAGLMAIMASEFVAAVLDTIGSTSVRFRVGADEYRLDIGVSDANEERPADDERGGGPL